MTALAGGDLAAAVAEWRHLQAGLWTATRAYAAAVAVESDALLSVALLSAAAAPAAEVAEAREVLARAMAERDNAGRRLGLPAGLPLAAARAAEQLLTAARTARVEAA